MNALVEQMAAQHKAAWPGFVSQAQLSVFFREFLDDFIHGIECAADDAVTTNLGGVLRCHGNGDGFFMDAKANAMHDLFMGVWFRYSVINDPASPRVFNTVRRSASAENPRLQPESNTRSGFLLSHNV
jgi:hypothetical protein